MYIAIVGSETAPAGKATVITPSFECNIPPSTKITVVAEPSGEDTNGNEASPPPGDIVAVEVVVGVWVGVSV
jgi:hypothetical protein